MLDFKEQLKRQIGFLQRSCISFDQGYLDEGVRIATTIRVLMHDTRASTSLLSHLKSLNINIYSTIGDKDLSEITGLFGGLYGLANGPQGSRFVPMCHISENHEYEYVNLDTWINQIINLTSPKVSRRDVYLGAANKEGGAHVDDKLSPKYESTFYKGGIYDSRIINGEETRVPIEYIQLVILRQMAHELLISDELINLINP